MNDLCPTQISLRNSMKGKKLTEQ